MGSVQLTLTANVVSSFIIPAPTYRVVATMISAAAETYITADGSTPVTPTATPNTSTQTVLAPVAGAQCSIRPILPGQGAPPAGGTSPGGSPPTQVQLLSAGTSVVELEW